MSDDLPNPRTVLRVALGLLTFGAWLFLVGAQAFVGIGELIVSFAIAVVVPLGVRASRGEGGLAYERVQRVVGLCAPVGMVAFAFPPGRTSAALSAVWLAATLAVAARGLVRVRARGFFPLDELAIDLGHLLLPIGGAWLFASRAGMSPFGFFEPIVLYTAAHFHFAGFAACLVVGLLGRALYAERTPSLVYRAAASVVMAGVPLVAAGITVSRALEGPAAVLLGVGMLVVASLLWLLALRRLFERVEAPPAERWARKLGAPLFFVAGLALLGSMMLAVAFALTGSAGRGAGQSFIPFGTMALLHGSANAFGFATCALLAFAVAPPPAAGRKA